MAKLKVFENGLRLVYHKIDGMYSQALGVWVGAGSSDETIENNGISHFIEHMLFKGTKNRTAFDITDSVDRIGAQINAFTSKECTCYYTKALNEHCEMTFDILSDMFFNSLFSEEEMKKEKGVVLEEISMCEDIPDEICMDLLSEGYYGKNPLAKTIIGTSSNVKGYTKKDIEKYLTKQYNPKNIVISIAGNIDEEKVIYYAEKYFANNFKNANEYAEDRAIAHTPTSTFLHRFKQVEQAHIALAFKNLPFLHHDMEKAVIITNILGGGMSSRLFQSVRENKGLAYSVYSFLSAYKNNGMLAIYAGVNPSNTELTTKTIRDEIEKMQNKGITKDEFVRAKEQMKGSFVMSQEVTASVMTAMGKYMVVGNAVYNMQEKIQAIENVQYNELCDYIKTYFDFKNVCGSYVGPEIENYNILECFKK